SCCVLFGTTAITGRPAAAGSRLQPPADNRADNRTVTETRKAGGRMAAQGSRRQPARSSATPVEAVNQATTARLADSPPNVGDLRRPITPPERGPQPGANMAQTIPLPTACANETVHVVDDDPAVQKLFQQLGCIEGFTVTTYDTAGSFLEAVDGQRPGCAVVDLILPDRSGLHVLRELAARGSRMPVVFMSGLARATEAVSALKLGSLDFVEKPFAAADMVDAIRRGLEADRALRQRTRNQVDLRARFAGLTPRAYEVMQL